LPRIGYRFLPKVECVADQAAEQLTTAPVQAEQQTATASPAAAPAISDRFSWLPRIAAVALVLAVVFLGLSLPSVRDRLRHLVPAPTSSSDSAAAAAKPRPSIAILGFKNLTGRPEEEWLSTAFSEMLTTELGAGGKLRVIPGENIARMKSDLSLPEEASYTRESLQRIRGNLGSDMVVLGTYTALGEKSGGQVRLDLRLQDASTGETSAILSTTGTEAKLFDLVSQAGEQLREKAGIGIVPSSDTVTLQAALPETTQAAQLYSEGLARLRSYDTLSARPLLERAVQADPKFALAHSALSSAWQGLGYELKGREEAKQAFELSSSLSREQQLYIEGRYRLATNDWKRAIEVYQSLYAMFPDNLDYGLQLTNAKVFSRKAKDALTMLESFRKAPLSPAYAPRVDLQIAFAKEAVSDLNGAIESAKLAETESRAIGAKEMEARALHVEASGFLHTGQLDKSVDALEQAKQLYQSVGNKAGAARVLCDEARVNQQRGNLQAARKIFTDSLGVFQSVGDQSSSAVAMADIASILKSEGDLAGAKKMYEEAVAARKEIGSHPTTARFELATVIFEEGKLTEAKAIFDDLLAASNSAGDKFGIAASQSEVASVLFAQGKIPAAKKLYEDSIAASRAIGDEDGTATTLESYALLLLAQNDLAGAHRNAQEAVDTFQRLSEKLDLAESRVILATVLLEEGNAAQAEALARQSAQALGDEKASMSQAEANSLLALALLAQNNLTEAQKASNEAQSVAAQSQFLGDRLFVGIRNARVLFAAGHSQDAIKNLEALLAEAKKSGYAQQQLEAALALDEMELKAGKASAARTQLASLNKEATGKGFLLVAHKASELAAAKKPVT
jgi:tetratricopeptide (TPR) repeat protein